jgi:single-strand DNA-binding protein
MASFNKVILLGNVTRDPELRYVSNGTPVTEIGLAVNNRRKGPNGEWVDETTFVDVTFWSRDAEIAGEYVTKGSPLMIEGRLKLDTWEKDGKKNSKLRVVGEKLVLLGTRQGGPEAAPRPKRAGVGLSAAASADGPDYAHGESHGEPHSEYDGSSRDSGGRGQDTVSHAGSDDDIPF